MKLKVSNLGRIKSADLDIKPLTVFIGKANTNKTWTAYALYGILRTLTLSFRGGTGPTPVRCKQLDEAIDTAAEDTAKTLYDSAGRSSVKKEPQSINYSVSRDAIFSLASADKNIVFELDGEGLANVLAADVRNIPSAKVTLSIPLDDVMARGKIRSVSIDWNGQLASVVANSASRVNFRYAFGSLSESNTQKELAEKLNPFLRWLALAIFDDVIAFPAERNGLAAVLNDLSPASPKNPKSEPALNVPSLDFLQFLSTAQRFPFDRGQEKERERSLRLLETKLMNGRAVFSGSGERRPLSYKSDLGHTVQINASASFVRSLAGLDVYLRLSFFHDLIVIDEPEMNAHPEAQLMLVELFAILANEGRHVIVTTHSPYFLDHLNNLIEGFSMSDSARQEMASKLKLEDADAFISPKNVSAYLFGEDGSVNSLMSDGTIDVGSFAHETDFLANLYSEIIDAEKGE